MNETHNITRRQFVKTAAVAAGMAVVNPAHVRAANANSALRLGLLGCGGRGTTVADVFVNNTNTRVVALADLFEDKLEQAKKHYDELVEQQGYSNIERRLMFKGPYAYKQIANCKDIDVVLIATPDYFHPEHLDAVVEAGKHVYCEKPAAVDVVGCKRFIEISKKVKGRFSLDVGFNVHHAAPFYEMVRRVHAGAIGTVACASVYYHAPEINYPNRPNASPLERRIRNFYWDRVISGDVILDQNIHVIDISNWILKAHPIKAVGAGGRKVRTDPGNIWDHFAVIFTYPQDVRVSFNSVQFGKRFWDVGGRYFGDRGVAESYYSGLAQIVSDEPWSWQGAVVQQSGDGEFSTRGSFDGLANCDAEKVKSFVDSITSGNFHNEAYAGAESALSAILGRMAAYRHSEVTWDEMMASNQSYQGEIDLTKL